MIRPCPICRKPTDSKRDVNFPFCSDRCRVLDLGNWASEKYRVSQPLFDESEFEGAGRKPPESSAEDDGSNGGNQ